MKKSKKIILLIAVVFIVVVGVFLILQQTTNREPKVLDTDLEQITFSDFGAIERTYVPGELFQVGHYENSLEGKVFSGNLIFSETNTYLWIGGKTNPWNGIGIVSGYTDDPAALTVIVGDKVYTMTSEEAGVKLVGEQFNLKLSYQIQTNKGNKTELELGVWINDKLYDNRYIYVSDYEEYLGGCLGIYSEEEEAYLTIESDESSKEEAVLDPNLAKFTLRDYGVAVMSYAPGDAFEVGTYPETMENKVFSANLTYSSERADLWIGGETSAWYGIGLCSGFAENPTDLTLKLGGRSYTLTPEIAGTALVNEEFNLKLSYQTVDQEFNGNGKMIKIGLWFNEKLYGNGYFYLVDYDRYLVGKLGVYTQGEKAELVLKSDDISTEPEQLNSSLKKLTFRDFGTEEKNYVKGDKFPVGKYQGSLEGKVFCGRVTFSASRSDLWIGGEKDAWGGIGLLSGYTRNAENISLKIGKKYYTLTPTIAGTTLIGESFNLKLSYQTEDTDGNGSKDQLKLGVWINDKLYGNEYFYVTDYSKYLVGNMGIYPAGAESFLKVESEK